MTCRQTLVKLIFFPSFPSVFKDEHLSFFPFLLLFYLETQSQNRKITDGALASRRILSFWHSVSGGFSLKLAEPFLSI